VKADSTDSEDSLKLCFGVPSTYSAFAIAIALLSVYRKKSLNRAASAPQNKHTHTG
jgi:hypothetical protein